MRYRSVMNDRKVDLEEWSCRNLFQLYISKMCIAPSNPLYQKVSVLNSISCTVRTLAMV